MPLTPAWRIRLFTTVAAVVAVWMGVAIAQGESLPALVAAVLLGFAVTPWLRLPLGSVLLGAMVFGYIVGNRGFAQITLAPTLPILPAEGVLALAGLLFGFQCAWRRELPFRRDVLNVALLLWICLGALRIVIDVRSYGLVALRDFATVYYAGFFYLAQESARNPASRRFLVNTLMIACVVLLPVSLLFNRYPELFMETLAIRGIPVIYFKGDLVGTFLAIGSVMLFMRYEAGGRWWNAALSIGLAGAVLATTNRASMLGLMIAATWLLVGRRWHYAVTLAGCGGLASALILLGAVALNQPIEKTPVYGVYERAMSLVDFSGQRTYLSADSASKGDNNQFRRVWWGAVIDETIEGNPWVGLGFGSDLAERFVREYYADSPEEFSTRSPHNILLTVFARMGLVGLLGFLVVLGVAAVRTWRSLRGAPLDAGLWCSTWIMLASACLGVVLEGPMGAVVFWIILGVASTPAEPEVTSDKGRVTREGLPVVGRE
ncbi:MAG TPA: O-antigen ligase family protein [Opitutaceae bacterium]|nr:O-antigen ligase family protein [Opitutaceae bacterium]HND61249.1 O-antigen ligase family protein [Opitutaceae bacterium]